ncbi:hypothetical protein HYH02_001286 [Chlamydomonas schloesseri]|uniref:phytol kinase n=1 Tax=Chlamydomonas schloesseri TaxID=2026947 RepID=A0A836BC90_9CHLO|nr:hypothetical protein HYH02_001286 [Chlamydomonas schloesseri]|eukprot:KAG2454252.1 hypothetical protein HYH02_001286 [Chlamydomonas schloesseri]
MALLVRVLPVPWLHSTRAPLALLRANLLSTYARVIDNLGRTREGAGPRGSGSGSVSGAADPHEIPYKDECMALMHMVSVLTALTPAEMAPGHATLTAELLAALGRSQMLEHAAAAALRLAAACPLPDQPAPAQSQAQAAEAPPCRSQNLRRNEDGGAWQKWQYVCAAVSSLCNYLQLASAWLELVMEPPDDGAAGSTSSTSSSVSSSSSNVGSSVGNSVGGSSSSVGGSSSSVGGSGCGARVAGCAQLVQGPTDPAHAAQALLGGPCVQAFLVWSLACLAAGDAAAAFAEATAEPTVAMAPAAAAAGAGKSRPPPLPFVRPLMWGVYDVESKALLSSVMVVRALAAIAKGAAAAAGASPIIASSPCIMLQRERAQQVFDLLLNAAAPVLCSTAAPSEHTAEPSEYVRTDLAVRVNSLLGELLEGEEEMGMRPAQAAARLPRYWRQLLQPLGWELDDCTAGSIELIGLALGRGRGRGPAPATAAASGAAAADTTAAAAGPCCDHSLRCALDAGLVPALEGVLRSSGPPPPPAATSLQGATAKRDDDSARSTIRDAVLSRALCISGVWPDLLAHAPVPQVAGLIATLAATARRVCPEPPSGPCLVLMLSRAALSTCAQLAALLEQQMLDVQTAGLRAQAAGAQAGAAAPLPQQAQQGASGGQSSGACGSRAGLSAAGGAPPPASGPAAAAQQALLASFALQQWLPHLLNTAATLVLSLPFELRSNEVEQMDRVSGGLPRLPLALAILRLMTHVAVDVVVRLAGGPGAAGRSPAGGCAAGAGGADTGTAAATAAAAAPAARPAAAGVAAGAAPEQAAATVAAKQEDAVAAAHMSGGERVVSWWSGLFRSCEGAIMFLARRVPGVCQVAQELPGNQAAEDLERALTSMLGACAAAYPVLAIRLALQREAGPIADALRKRGCGWRELAAFLEDTERAREQVHVHLRSGASEDDWEKAIARAMDPAAERAMLQSLLDHVNCTPQPAGRLLAPVEVAARLREAGVVPNGDAMMSHGGDQAAADSAPPPAAGALCANPACSSLDGPSALIAPGRGKTCRRCGCVTYCCGACQLQHWREGGHEQECAELAKGAAAAAAAAAAGPSAAAD